MLELHQPPPAWGIPNMSPFCVKLETYLKMAKIPYTKPKFDFKKAPKGKIPFIKIDDKFIGDSGLIIDLLKEKFGDPLDSWLGTEQKAHNLALQRLTEEHLYFAAAYLRWYDEDSFAHVKEVLKKIMPPLIGSFIIKKLRKGFLSSIKAQGVARHSREEIIKLLSDDLRAVSVLLGEKKYFAGDRASSIDATMYGFMIQQYYVPWKTPVHELAESLPNLKNYCERMKKEFWT